MMVCIAIHSCMVSGACVDEQQRSPFNWLWQLKSVAVDREHSRAGGWALGATNVIGHRMNHVLTETVGGR